MQKQVLLLGAGGTLGASGIAITASIDHFYALPSIVTIAFVCIRWGAGRQRRPMPESWFEPRKH